MTSKDLHSGIKYFLIKCSECKEDTIVKVNGMLSYYDVINNTKNKNYITLTGSLYYATNQRCIDSHTFYTEMTDH